MSVVQEQVKTLPIWTENYTADGSLADYRYRAVMASGAATGKVKCKITTGEGVVCLGILQNAPADGEQAEVLKLGRSKATAYDTFNSGTLLKAGDAYGKLTTAGSGDFVIARAIEAAVEAGQIIAVEVLTGFHHV